MWKNVKEEKINKYNTKLPTIILFYVNWCTHSKDVKPVFKSFTENLKINNKNANTMMINCDKKKNFSKKFKIIEYPTILFLHKNQKPVKYRGNRTVKSLLNFFTKITSFMINSL